MAVFEAIKGLIILLAGFGLLALLDRDLQEVAEQVVQRLHLNPARHYPRIFIAAAGRVTDARLWLLAGAALLYAVIRLVEAYGLWRARRWAEWFAVATGAIYVPFEIGSLFHGITVLKLATLIVNLGIVAFMTWTLWQSRGAGSPTLAPEVSSS